MPFLLQLNRAITPATPEILVLFVLLAATLRNLNSHILLKENTKEKQAEILVETLIMSTEVEIHFFSFKSRMSSLCNIARISNPSQIISLVPDI